MLDKNTKLYGGAISCTIPQKFRDLSAILPIPDHQEVFIYHSDEKGADTPRAIRASDCILSFEILSHNRHINDEVAARLLFDDLALSNEAGHRSIRECVPHKLNKPLGVNHSVTIIIGDMEVARGSGNHIEDPRLISTLLCVIRIPDYNSDILISYNFPLDAGMNYTEESNMFYELVSTLSILDDSLFLDKQ